MPAGASLTPGLLHAARDRERAQPLAAVAALRRRTTSPPFSSSSRTQYSVSKLCSSVGRPNRPDLRDVRRAQPRHAALAFDRFDHRRLFAADVGAGAAAQLDRRQRAGTAGARAARQLGLEQRAAAVVLVAQVDVDRLDAHRPGGDQHAFDEAVRIALEVDAVLEGAGLAFVDVHRHQPRRRLVAHDAPLAPGREAGAAQAAQAGVFQRLDHRLDVARAVQAIAQQRVAALRDGRPRGRRTARLAARSLAACTSACTPSARGVRQRVAGAPPPPAPARSGRCTAPRSRAPRCRAAPAGAAADPARRPSRSVRPSQTRTVSAGAAAAAVGPFLHDVEVVIEARHLVHLGLRQLQLLRQRGQMRRAPAGRSGR